VQGCAFPGEIQIAGNSPGKTRNSPGDGEIRGNIKKINPVLWQIKIRSVTKSFSGCIANVKHLLLYQQFPENDQSIKKNTAWAKFSAPFCHYSGFSWLWKTLLMA